MYQTLVNPFFLSEYSAILWKRLYSIPSHAARSSRGPEAMLGDRQIICGRRTLRLQDGSLPLTVAKPSTTAKRGADSATESRGDRSDAQRAVGGQQSAVCLSAGHGALSIRVHSAPVRARPSHKLLEFSHQRFISANLSGLSASPATTTIPAATAELATNQ